MQVSCRGICFKDIFIKPNCIFFMTSSTEGTPKAFRMLLWWECLLIPITLFIVFPCNLITNLYQTYDNTFCGWWWLINNSILLGWRKFDYFFFCFMGGHASYFVHQDLTSFEMAIEMNILSELHGEIISCGIVYMEWVVFIFC